MIERRRAMFRGGRLALPVVLLLETACAASMDDATAWEPPAYFARECYTDVGGIRICYLEAGEEHSDAIVFVHGWSGNVHNWWDQYERFSRDHHVLVFDLPGHGKSDKGEHIPFSMDLWVDTVVTLMDQRGIERATVVGNSAGGNIAARVAIRHPRRVERLVLSDATGSGRDGAVAWFKPSVSANTLRVAGLTSGEHFPGDDPKSRARAKMVRSYVGTREERPYLESLSGSFAASYARIPRRSLRALAMPTLLIWGTDDPVIPKRAIKYFQHNIPKAQTFWVRGGGHNPNTLTPQVFNCVLEAFLDDRPVAACDGGEPRMEPGTRLSGPSTTRSTAR